MTFLDGQQWQGKIFDGTWRRADGGERPVVEPATGDKLGTVGFANRVWAQLECALGGPCGSS